MRAAERYGFPLNTCTWIKGIFSAVLEQKIDTVIGVTSGDCSNTQMLMEVLELNGVKTIPFAYPGSPHVSEGAQELKDFARDFNTTLEAAEKVRGSLQPCRQKLAELDRLTWQEDRASGMENHYWLVSGSDMNGNPSRFCTDVQNVIAEVECRQPYPKDMLRLAFCGVPSVFGKELYPFLESRGARVVFNEIQRQFAMTVPAASLAEQYTAYTYPYATSRRIADIAAECRQRKVNGIIHYVQAFCHRAIGDIVFRKSLKYPILTLEGGAEFALTQHAKTRLEAFLDMIRQYKKST